MHASSHHGRGEHEPAGPSQRRAHLVGEIRNGERTHSSSLLEKVTMAERVSLLKQHLLGMVKQETAATSFLPVLCFEQEQTEQCVRRELSNMDQYPQRLGSPPPQTPRKTILRRWIIIVIVGVVLLLSGSILVSVILQSQNSPTATLQRFCDGYKHHDAQAMYATLSTSYQKVFPLLVVRNIVNSQKGESVDCTVNNVQQHGNIATGTLTVTSPVFGGGNTHPITRSSTPTLVMEHGQWKISNLGS